MIKELEFILSPLSCLKGYGEKTIEIYKKLLSPKRLLDGNKELKIIDLLYHKPEKILFRKEVFDLTSVQDGELITVKVKVDNYEAPSHRSQPHRIRCFNDTGFITIIYFKTFPDFIPKNFVEGGWVVISGKAERFNNELQITHPDYVNNYDIPKFEQIYPLTTGLSNRVLRRSIQIALSKLSNLPEWLDNNFLFQHQWKSWKDSLLAMHNAKNDNELSNNSPYIERLAFDELLANQIALGLMREKLKNKSDKEILINKNKNLKEYFLNKLPFELTNDQTNVINEIENDIYSNKRMMRLLQGDVGSGKTVVAFLSMLPFIENKKQVAFMVPTSILATQHYEWIKNLCDNNSNINVAILTGKIKGKKREKILNDLKDGKIDILVGTHAIFQDKVEFNNLSYVIIDEQHRFGVSQRLTLIEKGNSVDTLIMTATPIPRTLSLTIYGDMDVSSIKEKPKNRKQIITSSLNKEKFGDLINHISAKLKDGEKIYWICPLIEEAENLPATPLFQRYEEFQKFFKKEEIGFIHGKLTEDEKDKIMEDFGNINGKVKILIATTVIEVGIDVPDATIIIIESPERFGLSQMHQLRGRVGRGSKQSYCVLFYEKPTQNLIKRMNILKDSCDGFFIAEEDLKLRGSGEVLGLKQSGFSEYLIADLSSHYNLLIEASKMARHIVKNKEYLKRNEIKILLEMFGYNDCLNEAILN